MLRRFNSMGRKFFSLTTIFLLEIFSIVHAQDSKLTICRPECNGFMNAIPCRIIIKDIEGKQFYLGVAINEEGIIKDYNYMVGGDKIVLSLSDGIYTIQFTTPVSMQENYLSNCEKDWFSNEWIYDTKNGDSVIYIKPGITEYGYNGSWVIYE